MLMGHDALNITSYFNLVLGGTNIFGFSSVVPDVSEKLLDLRDNLEVFETYLKTTPGKPFSFFFFKF
jgi:hypothetical protein